MLIRRIQESRDQNTDENEKASFGTVPSRRLSQTQNWNRNTNENKTKTHYCKSLLGTLKRTNYLLIKGLRTL